MKPSPRLSSFASLFWAAFLCFVAFNFSLTLAQSPEVDGAATPAPVRTQRSLSAIANGSTVHIIYVAHDRSAESFAIADSRRAFTASAVQQRNISVVSHLVLHTEVPDAMRLYAYVPRPGLLIHVSVATDLFNMSIPHDAANVTFCLILPSVPSHLLFLGNVVQNAIPDQNMGMEAGILAGLVTKSNIIAMWYDSRRRDAVIGARAGILLVCPLCTLKAYALCSGGYLCPGEVSQAFTWAYQADVVITVYTFSNILPREVIALNANDTTTSTAGVITAKWRRVILIGNRLNDLSPDVSEHIDFLGAISIIPGSLVGSIVDTILGTFDGSISTVRYRWSTDLKQKVYIPPNVTLGSQSSGVSSTSSQVLLASSSSSSGSLPYFTSGMLTDFILRRQLFEVGALVPVFDVIALAQGDDDLIGGPPFIPTGNTASGLDFVTDDAGETYRLIPAAVTVQSAFCVHRSITVLISSDLRTALVYHVLLGQFVRVALDVFNDADYAAAKNLSTNVHTRADTFSPTWLQNSSNRRPTWPIPPRTGMDCNVMDDAFILSGGYILTDNFSWATATVATDVFRLIPMCTDRFAEGNYTPAPACDAYSLQNVTDAFRDSTSLVRESWDSTPREGGAALAVGGVGVSDARLPSARVFLPNYVLPYVSTQANFALGSVVNASTFETVATFRVFPPRGAGQTPTLRARQFIPIVKVYVAALKSFMAYDVIRRLVVVLPSTQIDVAVAEALIRAPSNAVATWEDATAPLPLSLAPLCIFYNRAASRFATLVTAGDGKAPHVYHYSQVLGVWVFQAAYDAAGSPGEQFGCVSLNEVAGGTALIVPVTTWKLSRMSLVYYPSTVPSCASSSGLALDVSQRTCIRCAVTEVATSDGFCTPSSNATTGLLTDWMIALIAVVASVCCVVWLVVIVRRCIRLLDPRRLARLPANAPPTGVCACLFIGISDADVMWAGSFHESVCLENPMEAIGLEEEQLEDMREIMEDFNDTLCKSVAANRSYLMSFRGDTAVIVGATPADVLCVAVETCTAFAAQDPPIRLSCGLHVAPLIQERVAQRGGGGGTKSKAGQSKETDALEASDNRSVSSTSSSTHNRPQFHYVGQGLHIASKLSGVSKKGRLMVTNEFLDDVSHHMLKHLGVVRRDTISVQVDATVVDARELVVQQFSDVFDSTTSLDEARSRRKRWFKERKLKSHTSTSRKPPVVPPSLTGTAGRGAEGDGQRRHEDAMAENVVAPPQAGGSTQQGRVDSSMDMNNPLVQHVPQRVVSFREEGPQQRKAEQLHASFSNDTAMRGKALTLSGAPPASPTSMMLLASYQEEALNQLASILGRLLLTNLVTSGPKGGECLQVLASKLHLPCAAIAQSKSAGSQQGAQRTVPLATVRAFAHRITALSFEDMPHIVLPCVSLRASPVVSSLRPTAGRVRLSAAQNGRLRPEIFAADGAAMHLSVDGGSSRMHLSSFSLDRPSTLVSVGSMVSMGTPTAAHDPAVDDAGRGRTSPCEPGRSSPHRVRSPTRDETFSPCSPVSPANGSATARRESNADI